MRLLSTKSCGYFLILGKIGLFLILKSGHTVCRIFNLRCSRRLDLRKVAIILYSQKRSLVFLVFALICFVIAIGVTAGTASSASQKPGLYVLFVGKWLKGLFTLSMELFSRRRWTTVSAQQSNMNGMMPCLCWIFRVCHKHNSLLIKPSSPSTKELRALSFWILL